MAPRGSDNDDDVEGNNMSGGRGVSFSNSVIQKDLEASATTVSSSVSTTPSQRERNQIAAFESLPWPLNCFHGCSTFKAKMITTLGCISSCIVLAIRLYLDHSSTTYLIHSVIVWTDMVLIHLFTKSLWLSVSGEVTTYVFFLSYHFTHEVVFELLETTVLAILCSFHLMNSRKEIGFERDLLEDDIESLRRKGALLLRNIDQVQQQLAKAEEKSVRHRAFLNSDRDLLGRQPSNQRLVPSKATNDRRHYGDSIEFSHNDGTTASTITSDSGHGLAEDTELTRELLQSGECNCSLRTFGSRLHEWLTPFHTHKENPKCNRLKCYRQIFFEYFLDGAAGVMYTSFLGLIIDALLKWGNNDAY